jgi:hypothetical protein
MSGLAPGILIESFAQLEEGLREWRSFEDPQAYDVGAMMALFCACVDNLRKYALPAELEYLGGDLLDDQRAVLKMMLESSGTAPSDK